MRILKILLFSFLLVSCGGSSDSDDSNNSQLQVSLILRDIFDQESDSFIQGEEIELFLEITYNGSETVTLNFNSGQQYDFYILSSEETELWRWSDGKGFTQALTELVIPAGETFAVTEVWDQTLPGDEIIAIGSYTVFGSFLDQSPEAEFSFTIQ